MERMKFNKEQLRALAALPDNELWVQVRKIAGQYGFKLPEPTPSPAELQKLRAVLANPEQIKMSEAIRLVNEYRRKAGC